MSYRQKNSFPRKDGLKVEFNTNELLTQSNHKLSSQWEVAIPPLKKGKHARGTLEYQMKHSDNDGRSFVSFLFTGNIEGRDRIDSIRIDFGTDNGIDFPQY